MDKEVAEMLEYFRQNASDLKTLGREWGLSDEEINECVQRAISIDRKDLPPSTTITSSTSIKFAARKSWPKMRCFLRITGVLMVMVCLGALAMQNQHIDHRISQIVQPVLYPLFRTVRLVSSPLHDVVNLYDKYFMEECFVNNPLFSKESQLGVHACENCETVTKVTQFTAASMEQGPLPGPAFIEPILVKGKGPNVSLETFQSILSDNPFAKQPMQGVTTNLAWASQVRDLLNEGVAEKLAAQPDFYFFWISKLAAVSQIMRKVFPRPDLLGEGSEVAIRKSIFITGPQHQGYQLPSSPISSFNWYAQGWGTKEVELIPLNMCRQECSPITVTLTAGDILTYNCDIYSSRVKAGGDDISVSFLGHFSPNDL